MLLAVLVILSIGASALRGRGAPTRGFDGRRRTIGGREQFTGARDVEGIVRTERRPCLGTGMVAPSHRPRRAEGRGSPYPRSLSSVDDKGNRAILAGKYLLSLGGAQPQDTAAKAEAPFTVTGSAPLPK